MDILETGHPGIVQVEAKCGICKHSRIVPLGQQETWLADLYFDRGRGILNHFSGEMNEFSLGFSRKKIVSQCEGRGNSAVVNKYHEPSFLFPLYGLRIHFWKRKTTTVFQRNETTALRGSATF